MKEIATKFNKYYIIVIALYVLVALISRPTMPPGDIAAFWIPAAKTVLKGYPFSFYMNRFQAFGVSFPLSEGPLFAYLITPLVYIASLFGIKDFTGVGSIFIVLPILAFDVLAGLEIRNTVKRLKPFLSESYLFLAFVLFLFSPLLWYSSIVMAHPESLLIYLSLLGFKYLEKDRVFLSGLFFATALLFKTTAILAFIPVLIVLLLRKSYRDCFKIALITFGLTLLVLSPFLIRHYADTIYSLWTFERIRPIMGLTIWQWTVGTSFQKLAISSASLFIIPIATILAYLLLRKKPLPSIDSPRFYGAIAISVFTIPVLTKWMSLHYFIVSLGFVLIWDMIRKKDDHHLPYFTIIFITVSFAFHSYATVEFVPHPPLALLLRSTALFLVRLLILAFIFVKSLPEAGESARLSQPA